MTPIRLAFFDVDETLIHPKSMFAFLADYFTPADYERAETHLKTLAAAGVPREYTNRAYYRMFAGHSAATITTTGRAWFDRTAPDLFNPHTLAWLRHHKAAGATIALVSGSFPACLDPIAEHVEADIVLCSRPIITAGKHTGELAGPPVIGDGKAQAVLTTMRDHEASPEHCIAYGDHSSDLPMLTQVAHRVIVGDDPALHAHLGTPGWHRLTELGTPQPA
ncbi:HAD family hydrolase [Actinokineospora inagensis]|uniref:HAD family hydrolase n=1 Tax=Actinokineospora inagensis TaxID=103730 RepID=UPI0003FD0789|nr:HAD-IB family hydrolase [Actinokineospora inagensis]